MANINVRIDNNVKAKAEAVFNSLGLTPTVAINLFYHQVIRTNSIPFELKADIPNEKTLKALNEIEQMEKQTNEHQKFDNIDEIVDYLLK